MTVLLSGCGFWAPTKDGRGRVQQPQGQLTNDAFVNLLATNVRKVVDTQRDESSSAMIAAASSISGVTRPTDLGSNTVARDRRVYSAKHEEQFGRDFVHAWTSLTPPFRRGAKGHVEPIESRAAGAEYASPGPTAQFL